MIPELLLSPVSHVVLAGAVGVAGGLARNLLLPIAGVAKDLALETFKGEFEAQALHRSVKVANRVFHLEKHPALTMLSHYLTDEKMEEASAAIAGAVLADRTVRSFHVGSLKVTTWREPHAAKTEPPSETESDSPLTIIKIPGESRRLSYAGISVYD